MSQKVPEQKLRELLSKIFEVPLSAISENASPDTIETWDSLRHMNLVVALEQAFDVELSDDQVVEILSYKLIRIVLQEHGVEFI
jgi:acyl carrier protein